MEQFLLIFGIFIVLFIIGVPIAVSLAFASMVVILTSMPFDMAMLALSQKISMGVSNFALLAIPSFVLAGNMMARSGMAGQLINLARIMAGKSPSALLNTNILGNMLFGAVSGSAMAGVMAVGGIVQEEERKEGYNPELSAAVNIISAPTGLLIPPSNTLIVYSLISGGTSVGALFLAGYLPGILMGLMAMIVAVVLTKKHPPTNLIAEKKLTGKQKIAILTQAIPMLSLIVFIVLGIIMGVFTATEGAVIAIAYVFVVAVFILKTLKLADFVPIMKSTLLSSCMVMFLIACSSVLSWVIAFYQIPIHVSNAIMNLSDNKYVLILMMNLLLLFVGMFMDMSPAILVFTPLLLPIAQSIGMHPVHFGIMMNYNLALGICTPPVGAALFAGCGLAGLPLERVAKMLVPFFIMLSLGLMLVAYIPEISMLLPRLAGLV